MYLRKTFFLYFTVAILAVGCKTRLTPQFIQATNIPVDHTISADSVMVAFYTPFKIQLEKEMNKQIGYSDVFLSKIRSQPEFLVGNFFADALLSIGKKVDSETVIAIATKDGIRTEVKKGPITVGSMFELMPFENTITILELKGKDVLELCEFIATKEGQPISGFTMQIKDNKPINILINGEALDLNKTYKLVTYDYLANGGDYIKGLSNPVQRVNTTNTVREELINYVQELTNEGKTVNTQLDGRITILK